MEVNDSYLEIPLLQHIIQFKWDTYTRFRIRRHFAFYVVFICVFAVETAQSQPNMICHGIMAFIIGNLLIPILIDMFTRGIPSFLSETWNIVAVSQTLFVAAYLALLYSTKPFYENYDT